MKNYFAISLFVTWACSTILSLGEAGEASPPEPVLANDNGDTNGDRERTLGDVIYLLTYIFHGGSEPVPLSRCEGKTSLLVVQNGDTNGDNSLDLSDAIYLLRWLFAGGLEPVAACEKLETPPVPGDRIEDQPEGVAGECKDLDNDGFGSPGSAACPNGDATDCDDSNPASFPGVPELCNGLDDNCDGMIDEGFHVGEECMIGNPDPVAGPCFTAGKLVCSEDKLGTVCELEGPEDLSQPEGAGGPSDPTCFDGIDNDCDGLTDHQAEACQGPELCNGFDDDNDGQIDEDFPRLGEPCSVGQGVCEKFGVIVCTADHLDTECSAEAGTPGIEGPSGRTNCGDDIDNDCDGLIDLRDPDCQSSELCDGLDNDGDDLIDEDFADLGEICFVGEGACKVKGLMVCSPDKRGTVCSAVASPPGIEGSAGETCRDEIDNDCDRLIDALDPDCGSAELTVTCALPYIQGRPGNDCTGKHRIVLETTGAGPKAKVTAELLAIDLDGNLIGAIPVRNGDTAHLASRIHPTEGRIGSRSNVKGTEHTVFAPVPLLRVIVDDGLNKAQAFSSNIPYVKVFEPADTVVSLSEGGVTRVVAAVTLVDPRSISIKVDGVDLLSALGVDRATQIPGGPFGGSVTINGKTVQVSELIIDTAPVDKPSSNSVTMLLSNLGCGGHIIHVSGKALAGAFPESPAAACNVDDLRDTGTAMLFGLEITSPTPGEVTPLVPTPVRGKVCHGRSISKLSINGLELDVTSQILTRGDGENSADTYTLPIDAILPATDLPAVLTGNETSAGSFDPGSNRLIADAVDSLGNRTFATFLFATGQVIPTNPLATQAQRTARRTQGRGGDESEISGAFVAGLSAAGLQRFFSSVCKSAGPTLNTTLKELPSKFPPKFFPLDGWDGGFAVGLSSVTADPAYDYGAACTATTRDDGKIHVTLALPDIVVEGHVDGSIKKKKCLHIPFDGSICICLVKVVVHVGVRVVISSASLEFDVTEEQLKSGGEITAEIVVPEVSFAFVPSDYLPEIQCIAGFFVDLFEFLGIPIRRILVDFLTFIARLELRNALPISKELPAVPIPNLGFNKDIGKFMLSLQAQLDSVLINAKGLTVSFSGSVRPTMIDPEVKISPGALVTPAPIPTTPIDGENAYLVLADDTFNQLLASLTVSGKLKTSFQRALFKIGDLIPNLDDPSFLLLKLALESRNITTDTSIVLRVTTDVPPRLLITDNKATDPVEVTLRANDLSVGIYADRDLDGSVERDPSNISQCFSSGSSDSVDDCLLFNACLDLVVLGSLKLEIIDEKPSLVTKVDDILPENLQFGLACGGAFDGADNAIIQTVLGSGAIGKLLEILGVSIPPLQAEGLDLGGFLSLRNLKLIAIETDGDPGFQEFLGVAVDFAPIDQR